ncbi:MAG TPA: helix-turn-helix domain-containing protein [Acetobacteraceae bacterium]|nr:helix-turn-helix domain-containing protein [Acetobacteraceae bacterium]
MPGSVTSVFSRPDDFEAALRNEVSVSLFITAYGQFQARLTQVELHRLCLSAIEQNLSLIGFLAVPAQQVLMSFPIRDQPAPIWGAIRPRNGEFMTFGPGHRTHLRTQGPSGWGSIWLPAPDLAACFHELTEATLTIPSAAHLWRPRPARGRRLLQLHAAAIRAADVRPETIVNAEAAHGMEQQLFEAVVECLSAAPSDAISQATHSHQGLMVQFEELLQAQPDRRPRAQELGAAMGVSDRLLRMCCSQDLGMSPAKYVQLRALHKVHRILRDADPVETRVSQVARCQGFRDLGRFAAAYRSLFGELPSITLGRSLRRHKRLMLA